jgi:hypothetical protein
MDICRTELPALEATPDFAHYQRCWLDEETKKREGARIVEAVHEVAS